MKIKWLIEDREVPKVGIMSTGEVKEVKEDIAKALIGQGIAEEVKPKAVKEKGE